MIAGVSVESFVMVVIVEKAVLIDFVVVDWYSLTFVIGSIVMAGSAAATVEIFEAVNIVIAVGIGAVMVEFVCKLMIN